MAKRKRKHAITCPYCRVVISHKQSQRDHVPPQCIFPPQLKVRIKENLIVVNCCAQCHKDLSVEDDALKLMIGAGALRTRDSQLLMDSIKRSFKLNSWIKKHFFESYSDAREISVKTFDGDFTGIGMTMSTKFSEGVRTSIIRIAKGILFKNNPYFDTSELEFSAMQLSEKDLPSAARKWLEIVGSLDFRVTIGQNAFACQWGFTQEQANQGLMIMSFYGGLVFGVFFGEKGMMNEMKKAIAGTSSQDQKNTAESVNVEDSGA